MIKTLTATLFATAYAVEFGIPYEVDYTPEVSKKDACVDAKDLSAIWSCGLAWEVAKTKHEMAEEGLEDSENSEEGSED